MNYAAISTHDTIELRVMLKVIKHSSNR